MDHVDDVDGIAIDHLTSYEPWKGRSVDDIVIDQPNKFAPLRLQVTPTSHEMIVDDIVIDHLREAMPFTSNK